MPGVNAMVINPTENRLWNQTWNRLEATEFIKLLAPDAHYASQWVFEELIGRDAISDYLKMKMRRVKMHAANDRSLKVLAELGITTKGFSGRNCVCLAQGNKENITAVVLFDIEDAMVRRFELCMPGLLVPLRSHSHPI